MLTKSLAPGPWSVVRCHSLSPFLPNQHVTCYSYRIQSLHFKTVHLARTYLLAGISTTPRLPFPLGISVTLQGVPDTPKKSSSKSTLQTVSIDFSMTRLRNYPSGGCSSAAPIAIFNTYPSRGLHQLLRKTTPHLPLMESLNSFNRFFQDVSGSSALMESYESGIVML